MMMLLALILSGQAADQQVGSVTQWFGQGDYPPLLIRQGVEGTVGIEFVIDVNGLVPTCRIVKSSGNQLLDETTCNLIKQRGRYRPSRDARGKPIAVLETQRVTWAIPRSAAESKPRN